MSKYRHKRRIGFITLMMIQSMKILLVVLLAFSIALISNSVYAEPAFVKTVKFIQYLDENTALEEVRNGNLDIYYYKISSDRLEDPKSREGLKVFDSTGGSYSILVNPAESEKFNPFSEKEVRFALNYLVDRKLIVNELMGGYGAPMISYYGPSDPEYLTIIEQLENFNFRYNPSYAEKMIADVLNKKGATKIDGKWIHNNNPIEITIFIRSDDPVRKSIGEILASELDNIGFEIKKEFGDLNKAFVVVYGSNPAELNWNLYTEGWGRSAFVRYDSVGLGQMYSPWFSNMPGFNDPTYWNYKNEYLDSITQKIYTSDFESAEQRKELIQEAITEGINESVRIFLASKIDQYVANEKMDGIVNDFGAGVPSRFTPINAKNDREDLIIGVKQIYQGAWNPIMGLSDTYSRHIWGIISDPATFKHPFSGQTLPIRTSWNVESAGPNEKLNMPKNAIIWDPTNQKWKNIDPDQKAISKVVFDFEFSNWHNGQKMDLMDVLYSLYFTIEWGTQSGENDKTFDTEFTPRATQVVQTIKGINIVDDDTIEVYVNYWHFDQGEIAEWASLWSVIPWEISAAMEKAVIDGKISYSRSGATSKNVNWASLIVPNDSRLIQKYLEDFNENNYIPESIRDFENKEEYFESRYNSSIKWIKEKNHAVISNGPFFLESYSPESRTIIAKSFDDKTYPFEKGHWKEFEKTNFSKIVNVQIPKIINKNSEFMIKIETENSDSLLYFISNSKGETISSETIEIESDTTEIIIPLTLNENLDIGANNLKLFSISNKVLKPDFYTTSFLVTEDNYELPKPDYMEYEFDEYNLENTIWILLPIVAVILIVIFLKRRKIHQISP